MDIEIVKRTTNCKLCNCNGGCRKIWPFYEVYKIPEINAATTANLLNFIGESLPKAGLN